MDKRGVRRGGWDGWRGEVGHIIGLPKKKSFCSGRKDKKPPVRREEIKPEKVVIVELFRKGAAPIFRERL